MAQQSLAGKSATMGKAVDQAYESARATKGTMPGETAVSMVDEIGNSISDFMPHAPTARREFNTLKQMVQKPAPKSGLLDAKGQPIPAGKEAVDTDIRALYDWRRKVSTLASNAKDRTEAAALKKMVSQFDETMDGAIKQSLMTGDAEAAKAWGKAIALRRAKGKVFESDDLVADLVEKEFAGGGLRLKVAPEAASNYIFGASNTGFITRPQLARELQKLRSVLGPKSQEWNAIREEAFLRLTDQAEGAFQGGKRGFSGVNLKRSVEDLQRKNPEVWIRLFDEGERKLINQFANVAARATNPVKGGANTSNTAVGAYRIVQSIGNALFMGEKGRAVLSRVFSGGYEGLQMGRAAQAASGRLPLREIPSGVVGGTAAAITSEKAK
jgi:hypothetical protein